VTEGGTIQAAFLSSGRPNTRPTRWPKSGASLRLESGLLGADGPPSIAQPHPAQWEGERGAASPRHARGPGVCERQRAIPR